MNFAEQLALTGLSSWLIALCVATAWERIQKRRDDEAWLDRHFAAIRADKARRDRLGRFLPKEMIHHDKER